MIILNILLVFLTWLGILWIFDQHKYLNIFEQLAFGFWVALSLFVFELFIEWVVLSQLSLILPIITFIAVLWTLFYKNSKNIMFFSEIWLSIKGNFTQIKDNFVSAKQWQKWVIILAIVYCLFKVFMVFSINTNMPTFDEDAVSWRDLKTKVFVENKSLVLNKNSPEFLGSALERNIFAPLTDTYFLLWNNGSIIWLTNIISPLVYLLSIFLLFGIFLRKTNLFYSILWIYIFCAIPFVFIQWIASYWNYISGFFLFLIVFYFLDNFKQIENKWIFLLLMIVNILWVTVRNESLILISAVLVFILISYLFYNLYFTKEKVEYKIIWKNLFYILLWLLIGYLVNKYVVSLYPKDKDLWIWVKWWLISSFFANLSFENFFNQPLKQVFYHTDYNILYLIFIFSSLWIIFNKKLLWKVIFFILWFIVLFWWMVFILVANPDLWLVTHYWVVRFWLVFVLLSIYISVYNFYLITNK